MTAEILDGKALAAQRLQALEKEVTEGALTPGLAMIQVGEDPASAIYIQRKHEACRVVGIHSQNICLPQTTEQTMLVKLIQSLNEDPQINGILVQLPLPDHIDSLAIIEAIAPHKDVDGFHPYNLGRLLQRQPTLRPCTPMGIMHLLEHYQVELTGRHVVIIGSSNHVGRPLILECLLKAATVTNCHRFTKNLEQYINQADIVISAMGKTGIINSKWFQPHAVVVDVAVIRQADQICGDIDFASAKQRVAKLTPVPGGVGPMTVVSLMENTVKAARLHSAPRRP